MFSYFFCKLCYMSQLDCISICNHIYAFIKTVSISYMAFLGPNALCSVYRHSTERYQHWIYLSEVPLIDMHTQVCISNAHHRRWRQLAWAGCACPRIKGTCKAAPSPSMHDAVICRLMLETPAHPGVVDHPTDNPWSLLCILCLIILTYLWCYLMFII